MRYFLLLSDIKTIDKDIKIVIIKHRDEMEGMMDTTLKSKNSQKASNIVKVLREQILTGMLKPGTRIMSARELSRHF
jgi:hypothetical protein